MLPNDYPGDASRLTALFIEGLDDTTYKRTRDQLYLTRESNLDTRWSFPQDWEQAATYFRDMPPDPLATPPPTPSTPSDPVNDTVAPTVNNAIANSAMKTPNQDNRARTPRRKTPLNTDTNESETNFSYTGNDGRQHVMPNFIPTYDPDTGRKYSKSDRIKLANDHFAKRSPPTAQTQPGNQRNLRPLPLTGYQNYQPPMRRYHQGRYQRRARYVDLDIDSDNPTDTITLTLTPLILPTLADVTPT